MFRATRPASDRWDAVSSVSSIRLQRSVTRLVVHLVWATAQRFPYLPVAIDADLASLVASVSQRIGCRALGVGNASDHVHVIAVHPPTLSVSELARRLKGATSRELAFKLPEGFEWQQGYFAESLANPSAAIAYVRDQRRHHEQPDLIEPWERALG
jgi:putative transposase